MARKKIEHKSEIRVTDPTTGGQKGRKLAQHSLIPPEFLHELAELFGRGAEKYDRWNWRKGYDWSLSYDAMQRHLNLFWSGVDMDEDTKAKHIMNAAWHCCVLAIFMDEFPEKDDRFKSFVPNERDAKEKKAIDSLASFILEQKETKKKKPLDPDDYMRR